MQHERAPAHVDAAKAQQLRDARDKLAAYIGYVSHTDNDGGV